MARLLWSGLLATACLCLLVVVNGQQRRRERRPVERLLVAGTSSKPVFSARKEEPSLVTPQPATVIGLFSLIPEKREDQGRKSS